MERIVKKVEFFFESLGIFFTLGFFFLLLAPFFILIRGASALSVLFAPVDH